MGKLTSVFVAGKDRLIAAALAAFCETLSDIKVLGWTAEQAQFLDCLEQLQPTVAIVEGMNVDALAKAIEDRMLLSTALLVMDDCVYTRRLPPLHSFVGGYLSRNSNPVEVGLAIEAVANDAFYISPILAKNLMRENSTPEEAGDLTKRQIEIVRLIAVGKSNKEIASVLKVSTKTVINHRAELMKRLRISNAAGLIQYVMRQHDITLP